MMVVTEEIKQLVLRRVSTGEISRAAEMNDMVRLRSNDLLKAVQDQSPPSKKSSARSYRALRDVVLSTP